MRHPRLKTTMATLQQPEAVALGLPFVAAYHIAPATAPEAIEAYRSAFRPSEALVEPYVVVSAGCWPPTTAAAQHRAGSFGHWVHSIRAGDAVPRSG